MLIDVLNSTMGKVDALVAAIATLAPVFIFIIYAYIIDRKKK